MLAKIVRVKIEDDKILGFVATSPDEQGLLATEKDLDKLFNFIPQALSALSEAKGKKVLTFLAEREIDPATDYPSKYHPFVMVPEAMFKVVATI
jgi:hypothetical protein